MFRQTLKNQTKLRFTTQIRLFQSTKPHFKYNKPVIQSSFISRGVLRSVAVVIGIGGSVYTVDKYVYSSLLARSIRSVYTFLWVAYEYSMNTGRYNDINELHEKSAESLLNLLMTNKGLYIKLGQAIANQGSIFPIAYQVRFERLYDNAPVESWEVIDKVLKDTYGENYETEIFDSIDHTPIASASIAQVHKGVLKDSGDAVAVKIQHSYIDKQIVIDLLVYRLIAKVYEKVFDLPLSLFTRFVSDQLIFETDFVHELENAEKLRSFINNDSSLSPYNVYIPQNYRELTTKFVLVSEWIDGFSLIDKQKLLDAKFNLSLIMKQYLTLFGRQIFKYGFIHSDPHPGNLIARFDNHNKQQLVLLDHGLYITLPETFRVEYSNLWRYLFSLDTKGIEDIGHKWGIGGTELFAALVQLRPVLTNTDVEIEDHRNVNSLFQDFIGDEKKFPLQLLFLTRTMRMIQNLNQGYGSPVNRVNLLTKASIDALATEKSVRLSDYLDLLLIRFNLFFSDVIFYMIRLRQVLLGDRYGGKGKGFEDYIEVYMQNTARSLGIEMIS
ncbi:putative mitochondrial chaperonin [Scheffersomyces coipomensis]|uniref:putative mitochondrial chaperonin n=1 Tax=Scheffersomyces coipomensis TaxID=1788519 RepID=UPI00315D8267